MSLSRTESKKIKRRNSIIETSIRLISDIGYEGVTMELIARESDIAKGTLYNYFSDKESIISGYIKDKFSEKNRVRESTIRDLPDTFERVKYLLQDLLTGVSRAREIFENYLVYQMSKLVSLRGSKEESGIDEPVELIISLGREEGDVSRELSDRVITDLFLFVFIQCVKSLFAGGRPEEVVSNYIDIFLKGIK